MKVFKKVFFYTSSMIIYVAFASLAQAANHIGFQVIVKNASQQLVNTASTDVKLRILSSNRCILWDETHTGISIENGYLRLNLGLGTPGPLIPTGVTFSGVFSNSVVTFTGLTCLNNDGTTNNAITQYTPAAGDTRILNVDFMVGTDLVNGDFNLPSTPLSMNSESLNGKPDTSFLNINTTALLTQINAETLFSQFSKLLSLISDYDSTTHQFTGNIVGNADTATTAGNVTGVVDITHGGTNATTAVAARTNLGLATIASSGSASDLSTGSVPLARLGTGTPNNTTYLRGDGAWAPMSSIAFSDILTKPTTLAGYGITDSVSSSSVIDISHGGTNAATAADARTNLGLGTSSIVNSGSSAGSVPLLGIGGLTADKMCIADGTAAGIICTSTIPTSSQWITTGSDVYYSTGNVGIGTNAPTATLNIIGSLDQSQFAIKGNSTQTNDLFQIYNSAGSKKIYVDNNYSLYVGWNGGTPITLNATNGWVYSSGLSNMTTSSNSTVQTLTSGTLINRNIADSNTALTVQQVHASSTGDIFQVKNNASTVFKIQQAGNVGVGTTTPSAKFEISGANTIPGNNPLVYPGTINLLTTDNPAINIGPSISFAAYRDSGAGANQARSLASIEGRRESSTNTLNDGFLAFKTNTNSLLTEALRITSVGNVGIGTTTPGYKLDVQGGNVNSAGAYTNVSDIRLKRQIEPLENSLEKILQLQPVSYYWKNSSFDSSKQIGFIAQEVEKIFPEVVKTDSKGFKAMSYSQLVSPVVEAIKELYQQVIKNDEAKDIKIKELEQRIERLEKAMDSKK